MVAPQQVVPKDAENLFQKREQKEEEQKEDVKEKHAVEEKNHAPEIKEEKKLCETELDKLLTNISNSDNKYLASTKNKLKEWKSNKKEKEIIEMIQKLIDYLNCQLNTIDKNNALHKLYIERINISKKKLISELKKIKI